MQNFSIYSTSIDKKKKKVRRNHECNFVNRNNVIVIMKCSSALSISYVTVVFSERLLIIIRLSK